VAHVQLKPGTFGVKVSIMPPGVKLPDQVEILGVEEVEGVKSEATEESTGEEAE